MKASAFRSVALGMVHGRFQPFHNGHLEYVLEAAGHCRELLVGITNPGPDPVPAEPASPHRHLAEANPFPFAERSAMIRAALAELAWLIVSLLVLRAWWYAWGPGMREGLADRAEVEKVLGLSRMRRNRSVIRPDLYPKSRKIVGRS